MDKQPAQPLSARLSVLRTHMPLKALFPVVLLRLGPAFLCGWLLAWLAVHLLPFAYSPLSLVFPLLPGIGAGVSVSRRSKYPVLLAILTGVLFLAGIGTYLLPLAIQSDAIALSTPCELSTYACSDALAVSTRATVGYLLYSLLLVLLVSSVTSQLIKQRRKDRQNS